MSVRRKVLAAFAVLIGLSAGAPAATAATLPELSDVDTLAPYKIVRTLEYVQDAIVGGDHAAMAMQSYLLGTIDKRLRGADGAAFDDSRNVDAALIYAMSGGNPATLDLLASRDVQGRFDHRLTVALQTYLSGQPQRALPMLKTVDKQFHGSPIEPYLTLVTANAMERDDPQAALKLFDWVRLLAPGSILEESALRREIDIADRLGSVDRGLTFSRIYAERFLHSPYAGQFADLFVRLVVDHTAAVDQHELVRILSGMDAERQSAIYLRIARAAAIGGKNQLAATSANRAGALDGDHGTAVLPGFYGALANVTSANVDQAMTAIRAVPAASLSVRDRGLRAAALAVAQEVIRPVNRSELPGSGSAAAALVPKSVNIYSGEHSSANKPKKRKELVERQREQRAFTTFVDAKKQKLAAIGALLKEDER